jgi:hypothetical protein
VAGAANMGPVGTSVRLLNRSGILEASDVQSMREMFHVAGTWLMSVPYPRKEHEMIAHRA